MSSSKGTRRVSRRAASAVEPSRLAMYEGRIGETPSILGMNPLILRHERDREVLRAAGRSDLALAAQIMTNEVALTIMATPTATVTEHRYKIGLAAALLPAALSRGHGIAARMIAAAAAVEVARAEAGGESTTAH